MKKWLGVLVGVGVFLASGQGWGNGETCTMPAAAFDWTAVNTISAGVIAGCTASSGDVYVFPDGSEATVTGDITFTTSADNGIEIQDGATFIWDQTSDEATITLFEGTTAPDAVTDVAFYAHPSSVLEIQGGFRQWGDATPEAQDTHTDDNYTTWAVDEISVCRGGGGGEIGTCSGGTDDEICLLYTTARNDPEDGLAGTNYLDEAMGELVENDDWVRFTNGGEKGWSYRVTSVDSLEAGGYHICFDVTRVYDQTSADFPNADRDVTQGLITATAVGKGATAVTSNASVTAADGDFVGRCIRFCDASSANCDTSPSRITRTVEGVANDVITFYPPLARDLVASADFTIDYCVSQGDNFVVETPAFLAAGGGWLGTDDHTGKVIVKSTDTSWTTGIFAGMATVKFENAGFRDVGYIDIVDTGDSAAGLPGIEFEAMVNVDIDWFTQSGGDGGTGNADQLLVDGVTGGFKLSNAGFRYNGAQSIQPSGTDNGSFILDQVKFEYSGGGNPPLLTDASYYSRTDTKNLFCFDCISGAGAGDFVNARVGNTFNIDGLLALFTQGGIGNANDTNAQGLVVKNMLILDAMGTRGTAANSFMPNKVSYCDIRGMDMVDNPLWNVFAGVPDGYFKNCVVTNATNAGDDIIYSNFNATMDNVIIWNAVTTNLCGGAACAPVKFFSNAADGVVTNITVGWPEGTGILWDEGILLSADAGGQLTLGSLLVTGLQPDEAGNVIRGVYADNAGLLDDHTTFVDSICVDRSFNIGAGGYVSLDPVASFTGDYYLGFTSRFIDPSRGDASLLKDGIIEYRKCGAKTGAAGPGLQEQKWKYMSEALMTSEPYKINLGSHAYGP